MKYWHRVLARARERKAAGLPAFTRGQEARADNWQTCACGLQDRRLFKLSAFNWHAPDNLELSNLGIQFTVAVLHERVYDAKRLLDRIDKLAAKLLHQMEATA